MNLNGAVDEIELPIRNNEAYVHNSWTNSDPIVIHGNGPSKVEFFGLYLFSTSVVFVEKFRLLK